MKCSKQFLDKSRLILNVNFKNKFLQILFLSTLILACKTLEKPSGHDYINQEVLDSSGAGAYVFLDSARINLNNDKSYTVVAHRILKILDESFIEYLANAEITYSRSNERFRLKRARTIKENGRVINIDKKFIVESRKYYDYPVYDDLMSVKFSYPNVQKGDILEILYEIVSDNKYTDGFFDYSKVLGGYYPTGKNELIITYPRSIKLNHRYRKNEIEVIYTKQEDDNFITETFKTVETPGYQFEPGMPRYSDVAPNIVLSTYTNWSEIAKWYKKLSEDSYEINDDIRNLVKKFQEKSKGDKDKLLRDFFTFVSRRVRYVGVWFGLGGVKPRKATEVYDNLYGDCKDKVTLFVAMLREAGINAWPVLVSSRGVSRYWDDFPAMIFNHAILKLEYDGITKYLDPTSNFGSYHYLPDDVQGRLALEITETPRILTLPMEDKELNGSRYYFNVDLDDRGGLSGDFKVRFFGDSAYSIRESVHGLNKKETRSKIQRVLLGLIPGMEVRKFSIRNHNNIIDPVEINVEFSSSKFFEIVDDLIIIPARLILFKRPDMVASKTRKFPLEFWTYWEHKTFFKYKIPPNYSVRNAPSSHVIDNDFFRYEVIPVKTKNKNIIELEEHFHIKALFVEPEAYLAFKRDYDKLLLQEKRYLVLQKKK